MPKLGRAEASDKNSCCPAQTREDRSAPKACPSPSEHGLVVDFSSTIVALTSRRGRRRRLGRDN